MPFQKRPQDIRPRWKPGESGNPKGRAKGTTIAGMIRIALDENNHERAKKLAVALINLAMKGNGAAINQIFNRIDGPVVHQVDYHIKEQSAHTDGERVNRVLHLLTGGVEEEDRCDPLAG
jgi:hypothetical protein